MLGLLRNKGKASSSSPEGNTIPTKGTRGLSKIKTSLTKRQNLLGLWVFLVLNAGGLGLVFLLQLVQLVQIGRVANKPPATLVEKSDGTGFLADAIPASQRTPKALQRFTSDILTALFTVTPLIQGEGGLSTTSEIDPGIAISRSGGKGNTKVTVNAYVAAVAAIAPGFRDEFLEKLAEITPSTAFSGLTQVFFKIDFLGEPRPIEGQPDEWTITVVGTRYIIEDQGGQTRRSPEPQPLRQVIYLKSVAPQFNPLPDISTDIQRQIGSISAIGLRITKMVPIDSTNPQGGDYLELPATIEKPKEAE